MRPTFPSASGRLWDGSPPHPPHRRPLRVTATSPSRLLRTGQRGRCRDCGNPLEWYLQADQQPVALHPDELPATAVPADRRWHVHSGIAHPAGEGTAWCRIPHTLLCPAIPDPPSAPHLAELRRHLALRTRRLTDTGALTPSTPEPPAAESAGCRPARPVVQLLCVRYLAPCPVEEIRCVAQTRHRHRCTHLVLHPDHPAGAWTLMPATAGIGQLRLPDATMAVYDLTHQPYAEQRRWYAQRCPHHATTPSAADTAAPGWEPFDPLLHHTHIPPPPARPHPAPIPTRSPRPEAPPAMTRPQHAVEITLTRPATPAELARARRTVPLAANAENTRLLTVISARTPGRALRRLHHRLHAQLPIGCLTTHYPDAHGDLELLLPCTPALYDTIRRAAVKTLQQPEDYLRETLTTAVTRDTRQRADRLDAALDRLLAIHTGEELLLAAARTVTRHRPTRPR